MKFCVDFEKHGAQHNLSKLSTSWQMSLDKGELASAILTDLSNV